MRGYEMIRKTKLQLAIAAVAVVAASVVDILYLQRVIAHHNAIASIRYTQTDISVILDGTYSASTTQT